MTHLTAVNTEQNNT